VRGTTWEMIDGCKGTRRARARGQRPDACFTRRRTVRVKAGRRYFARPRRR
jgi:hypothetical protein